MKRFAVYARYSCDLQNPRSIRDQINLCQARVKALEGRTVGIYADEGISGASMRNRPGMKDLIKNMHSSDGIVAESLDRLSRDQADIAWLHEITESRGIKLIMLDDGEVGPLHVGLKGTMNALFLRNLADKTRRGQIGRVREGRVGSGIAYGYRLAPMITAAGNVERGYREIFPEQAAIIRRIFKEYADGRSAAVIARDLNAQDIPSPSGVKWNPSTIMGSKGRRQGILRNPIYDGQLVFNKTRREPSPRTGKKIVVSNLKSEWVTQDAEHLRIIDHTVFKKATRRLMQTIPGNRRPLTPILFCGCCDGPLVVGRTGKPRIYSCLGNSKGECANTKVISERKIAFTALDYLNRYIASESGRKISEKGKIVKIDTKIARLAMAIKEGIDAAFIRQQITRLKEKKECLSGIGFNQEEKDILLKKLKNLAMRLRERGQYDTALNELRPLFSRIVIGPRRGTAIPDLHIEVSARGLRIFLS